MNNPIIEYRTIREKRATMTNELTEYFDMLFGDDRVSVFDDENQLTESSEGVEIRFSDSSFIRKKSGDGKETTYTIYIGRDADQSVNPLSSIRSHLTSHKIRQDAVDDVINTIVGESVPVQGTRYRISSCPVAYGVAKNGLWPTKQFVRAVDYFVDLLEQTNAPDTVIAEIQDQAGQIARHMYNIDVQKDDIQRLIEANDVDAIETLTSVTLPESRDSIRQNSLRQFGDESPPLARSFLVQSDNISIEYSDDDVTLFKGERDGFDLGLLVGVDDGGAFYHPLPRTIRLDEPNEQLNREDIRDLMDYDSEWSKGDQLEVDGWNRIQGDLLLKKVPEEKIQKLYERIELCRLAEQETVADEFITQTEILSSTNMPRFKFSVSTTQNLPRISVSYPRQSANTIEDDLRSLMGLDENTDVGSELVSQFIDWLHESYEIGTLANKRLSEELQNSPRQKSTLQLDNHLLFVDSVHLEPEPQSVYQDQLSDLNRDFTHFYVDKTATVNIQHNEHDPLQLSLDSGAYLLTLARRRT